jgi:hypothetical protein
MAAAAMFVPDRLEAPGTHPPYFLVLPPACLLQGYVNPKMERLRQGVGPEDLHLVEYIAPSEVPGLLREELPQLKE